MDDYVQQLENNWKASLPRFTPQFLRDTFPEAWKDVIPQKIKELECDHDVLSGKIRRTLKKVQVSDEGTQVFIRSYVKYLVLPQLIDLERNIARLKRLLIIREVGSKNMCRKIESAKQKSILDVASLNGCDFKRSGNTYRMRCRFHDERTPSLHFYPQTNSFYCFGCQKGGDVIQFIQDLLHLTFVEAVRYLTSPNV